MPPVHFSALIRVTDNCQWQPGGIVMTFSDSLGHLDCFGRWLRPLVGGEWLTASSTQHKNPNYLEISPLTTRRTGRAPCCRSLWGGARGTGRRSPSTWSPGRRGRRSRRLWLEAQNPCSPRPDMRAVLLSGHKMITPLSLSALQAEPLRCWNRSRLKTTR